ncbi:HAD family hydrolase [Streptomyces alkaliterrae]|uniref:HAD family phosphatase n=1 Tax=Streptomyces alkaliterrae TaxID=2213162 RepID=A0A5P0YXP9_9ACTN|nr:HAD family phosphatase [Streptomyces alkaliterrae]MQS04367.1 HAD-IA family hydrolase [Streptomyces alkaliterrae]
MDGTLVDTETLWWDATAEVAAAHGHELGAADAPEVVGRAVDDTAAHLARVTSAERKALARRLTDDFFQRVAAGAPLRPGADRLLAELAAEGVPFALVSASPRVVVDAVVGGSLAHVPFAFTLSADDTARTKPHPDPYQAAADRFGVPTGRCVAVEDSPDGAASAEAAGCALLVVPSLLPVRSTPHRTFAPTLADVTPATLRACLTRAVSTPQARR